MNVEKLFWDVHQNTSSVKNGIKLVLALIK